MRFSATPSHGRANAARIDSTGRKHPERCSAHAPVASPCGAAPYAASPSQKPQGRSADLLPCSWFPRTGMRAERVFPLGQHPEPALSSAMSHSERLPQRHRCRAEARQPPVGEKPGRAGASPVPPGSLHPSSAHTLLCATQPGWITALLCQTSTASAGISQEMTNEHNTSR